MKQAKQDHFRGIVERSEGDSKKLWSSLKMSGFNARAKSGARIVLDVDGVKCFDLRGKADACNRFFTNVARSLMSLLPRPFHDFSPGSVLFRDFYRQRGIHRGSFELSPVSRQFVLDQLSALVVAKSTGLDGISARFLRDGAVLLADQLPHC